MAISLEKINKVAATKENIAAAIINKGQTIENGLPFRNYVDKIENIRYPINLAESDMTFCGSWETELDLGMFNFENKTNYSCFFALSNLIVGPMIDLSKATKMDSMFRECANLQTIPLYNTKNVEDVGYMFLRCYNLTSLPLLNFKNVKKAYSFCEYCSNLKEIPMLRLNNCTECSYMFSQCTSLTNIPALNLGKAINCQYFAQGCINLVDIPQLNTKNMQNCACMFKDCNSLSNSSIHNIINMLLNSKGISSSLKNLSTTNNISPFYSTKFNQSYYNNRLTELSTAGWTY